MSEREIIPTAKFDCGDRILVRHDWQETWGIGIITDMFVAPISRKLVYVVNGEGYYEHELTAEIKAPEPQSLRA